MPQPTKERVASKRGPEGVQLKLGKMDAQDGTANRSEISRRSGCLPIEWHSATVQQHLQGLAFS